MEVACLTVRHVVVIWAVVMGFQSGTKNGFAISLKEEGGQRVCPPQILHT
jgi:hypothetical protein